MLATAAVAGEAPAPRARWDAKDVQFGQIVRGDQVERVFRVRNEGDADLELRRVKPSCGCTIARVSKERVPPGETAEIVVRFESGERQGPQDLQIQVVTNDPKEKDFGDHVTILHLRGEVANLCQVIPQVAYFASFLRGKPIERRITILPVDRKEVAVLAVESPLPWIRVESKVFEQQGKKGAVLSIVAAEGTPIGALEGAIKVRTDHPRQPLLDIPLLGQCHGAIVHFPDRLALYPGGMSAEMATEPTVHLQRDPAAPGTGVPIVAIETPGLPYRTVADEVLPGRRVDVRLELDPAAKPGPFAGAVRIFLADPDQPLVEVPVYGELPAKVRVEPRAVVLALGEAEAAGSPCARLRVHGPGLGLGRDNHNAKVEGEPLTAAFTAMDTGGVEVVLALLPGTRLEPGPIAGTLVIETTIPGEERTEVPIRGDVRAADPSPPPPGPQAP